PAHVRCACDSSQIRLEDARDDLAEHLVPGSHARIPGARLHLAIPVPAPARRQAAKIRARRSVSRRPSVLSASVPCRLSFFILTRSRLSLCQIISLCKTQPYSCACCPLWLDWF